MFSIKASFNFFPKASSVFILSLHLCLSFLTLIFLCSSFFSQDSTFINYCYADAAEVWQLGLQDPATPIMESMLNFHNYLMLFLIAIGIFVTWMLFQVYSLFNESIDNIPQKFTHSSLLEIIWTIFPAFVLLLIAIPSFALLYSLDELIDPSATIKIIGHQWYWSYEISDYASLNGGESLNFDSYMIDTNDLTRGAFRLLEVDQRVILPINTHIRLLVTAADVLHSWAIPSFGIKIDACPGRLSQGSLFIKREGVYYGQCSEICGTNHGFMPIVVKGVEASVYVSWILIKLEDLEQVSI
jgi:cytochrome c oxidase subunit 2